MSILIIFVFMKKLFLFSIGLLFIQCTQNADNSEANTKDIEKNVIHFAKYFRILETKNDTLLHIVDPENEEIEKKYLITSSKDKSREGYKTLNSKNRIIALSGTFVGMLSVLNEQNSIVGISNKNYIYDSTVLLNFYKGKVTEIGSTDALPVERIINSNASLLAYSGFDEDFVHQDKLEDFGIQSVPVYDWREQHPLGKAEWIVLFGYLTGKSNEAKAYITRIENEYNKLIESRKGDFISPVVLAGNVYGDVWNGPKGDSYMAKIIEDAGGDYLYKETKGTGSIFPTLEKIVIDSKEADIWINPGLSTKGQLLNVNQKADLIEPFKNDLVYCYSSSMNKYWELGAVQPHHLLSDLIHIFRNPATTSDSLYFYRKLTD